MVLRTSFLALTITFPAAALAQPQSGAAPAPQPVAAPASAVLRPSMEILKQAIASTNVDRWKASSGVRDANQENLQSIQRDLESTLPALLSAADAAPGSVSKTLPVFRNVDALYDVLLRVDITARIAAPKDQISALDQAITSLGDSRRTLGDQLQSGADTQEAHIVRLQTALKAVPPPAPPAPVACTPAPVRKRRTTRHRKETTAAKSSSATSQTTH